MIGDRRRAVLGGLIVLGGVALVMAVVGPPSWGTTPHLILLGAGVVVPSIGIVALLSPSVRVAVAPTLPQQGSRAPEPVPTPNHRADRSPVVAAVDGPHVRDALIDRWGNVYGAGSLNLPPDSSGRSSPSTTRGMRLEVSDGPVISLVACSIDRDPTTEYVVARPEGPTLQIGPDLASALLRVLRFGTRTQRSFAFDSVASLQYDSDAERHSLFDVRATVEEIEEGISLRIVASLRCAPSRQREPPDASAWPQEESERDARVELTFDLDAVSRAVRFGSSSRALEWGDLLPVPPLELSTVGTARLGATPLRSYGLFGLDLEGRLVALGEGFFRDAFSFSAATARLRRYPSGLIAHENSWPRVSLRPVRLDEILQAHSRTHSPSVTLSFEGADLGRVEYSSGGSGGPGDGASVRGLRIESTVGETGLRLTYRLQPVAREQISDSIVLPWEVLVVRTSALRRWQQKYVGAASTRGDDADQ